MTEVKQRVLRAVDDLAGELVDFTAELVRLPTVNPPGEAYEECARVIGGRLERGGFAVEYVAAEGRPEHTARHPRLNVMGRRAGRGAGPVVHLNGHFDVVPAGGGWTVDPFGGEVRDGRIWGRGTGDMKAGLAAAIHAAEALRRAGAETAGALEVSGTVDEESGGFAGVAFLARTGRIARGRTDYVIIPEPLGADRICIGHRGVWWFEVELKGRIAHGSMPFLGVSAIEHMAALLEAARAELFGLLEKMAVRIPAFRYEVKDLMIVHPVRTPEGSPVVAALGRAISAVRGKDAALVASPGTYDQKHVARIAGVEHCVAYGPGVLELAHQPDEWCSVQDLVDSTKVLALAALELGGAR